MRRYVVVVAVLAMALAAGCGDDDDGSADAAGGGGGGESRDLVYVSPVGAQPGQQEIMAGIEQATGELGWKAGVLDSNLSPDRQVANIDTAITQNRDAITSWTLDPGAAAGAYQRAIAADIPVIGMNSEGEGVTSTVWWEYITCDEGGPSTKVAEFIAERKPGGKVIVMSGPPAPSIVAHTKCFTEAAKAAGLEVVDQTDNTEDTAVAAQRLMEDLLTRYPDVDAVWNYNDQSALGDVAAITGAGKKVMTADGKDGIIVIGHNGDKEALDAVRSGRLTATVDPDNYASGMAAVKLMQTAIEGGADKTYPPLTVKATMYTSENIDEWKPAAERGYTLDSIPLVGSGGGS
jgi:ribose transport system substrate-binding protein